MTTHVRRARAGSADGRRPTQRARDGRPGRTRAAASLPLGPEPLWYKDAVIYELHVRAFFDSNGDGSGDFPGLTQRLDYLQDLGVTAIWLLPFYPSPRKDDGYDIADYTSVHPEYGTLRDVRALVREAHRRGLRVITELVCNHTSDQHPWFQRARSAARGSAWRDFYVWSDTPDRYRDARVIFKDFETSNWSWDAVAGAYYWHRFYSHQPDLNFGNPRVRDAMLRTLDFWLELGVDGLRLDAIPYLYEREGTNCENLPETHAYLRELRRHVDERFSDRMLLAEANQWPEEAVEYFGGGTGDECHMAFHFPVMPRMYMALRLEDRFPIIDILDQTPQIPETSQWALFLRNHDELTLEMVTDEERDYMYRVYAHDPQMRINLGIRRRLAPLLGNNRRRIELLNGLLFALPGTPVLYYGDEIGMGDNVYLGDRNGVRTPMQWSGTRNAGFSDANRQRLYLPVVTDPEYHYEATNVEAQQNNPHSLLWWMKRLIALRKQHPAFGRGTLRFLHPENRKVLAFVREHAGERILVVANLSRFSQYAELDLSAYEGDVPVEMFGHIQFPRVQGDRPFLLTLGPHGFFWFVLERHETPAGRLGTPRTPDALPVVPGIVTIEDALTAPRVAAVARVLGPYVAERRWFRAKARRIKGVRVADSIAVPTDADDARIAVLTLEYTEGEPDTYVLPLAIADGEEAGRIWREVPHAVVARAPLTDGEREDTGEDGGPVGRVLYDAFYARSFSAALLEAVAARRRLPGRAGQLTAAPTRAFRQLRGDRSIPLEPAPGRAEQTNTSVTYGDRFILKLFRRLDAGLNPEVEIGQALTEQRFPHSPPVAGVLEYHPGGSAPVALGILQGFVPNEGDAWSYTLDAISAYFERAASIEGPTPEAHPSVDRIVDASAGDIPELARETIGVYLDSAWLLGARTADLHCALASLADGAFTPEPFTPMYQRALYQTMRGQANEALGLLSRALPSFTDARPNAERVVALGSRIHDRLRGIADRRIAVSRIRCHGDFHAGQVLWTGKDFVIIDFEGEPGRPLSERRHKRSALTDVAGMLRSFHYAAYGSLLNPHLGGSIRPEDVPRLEPWARFWYHWVAASFLAAYRAGSAGEPFMTSDVAELTTLLDAYLLQKALYELAYELNNRPDWASIPIRGILEVMSDHSSG